MAASKKGFLNPERFVPLLEQEGRIDRLDLYNLEKSCAFLQKLNEVREEIFTFPAIFPAVPPSPSPR